MFKHYVCGSEVTFVGASELIGLSPNYTESISGLFASDGYTLNIR